MTLHEDPFDNSRADELAFETVVGLLNYPMFVVTTAHGTQKAGCLVGFASQVSINPPRFLVGLSDKNYTFKVASRAEHLAVHVIPREELHLARLFGGQTGDEIDKFAHCNWRTESATGLPVLTAAAAWFSGRILERLPLGDHVAFLLAPNGGSAPDQLGQLVTFADVHDLEPGHEA